MTNSGGIPYVPFVYSQNRDYFVSSNSLYPTTITPHRMSPPKDHRVKWYLEELTSVSLDPLTRQETQELVIGLLRYAEEREDADRRARLKYRKDYPAKPEEKPHV